MGPGKQNSAPPLWVRAKCLLRFFVWSLFAAVLAKLLNLKPLLGVLLVLLRGVIQIVAHRAFKMN
jgi:hypothetical protein